MRVGASPAGLSIGLLLTFGVMLVLGFAVYASLYAGAASLVSRQEDINQIVAPLTFVSVGGYLVSTYAGTGLIPIDSPLVVVLSFVPLFSPVPDAHPALARHRRARSTSSSRSLLLLDRPGRAVDRRAPLPLRRPDVRPGPLAANALAGPPRG